MADIDTYLINLDRRSDRLEKFTKKNIEPGHLHSNTLTRISAVDPDEFSYKEETVHYRDKSFPMSWLQISGHLKKGEIGCLMSHYFLWEKCAKANKPILVFEDDALVVGDFTDKLESVLSTETVPDDIDILWIGTHTHGMQCRMKNQITDFSSHYYKFTMPRHYSIYTYCYLIYPQGANKLIDLLHSNKLRHTDAADHFLCNKLDNHYILLYEEKWPFLCSAPQGDSDIQKTNRMTIPN